jgi:isoamylase
VLAFTLGSLDECPDLHVMLNMEGTALDFELPPLAGREWRRWVDTAREAPGDVTDYGSEVPVTGGHYQVEPHTSVVLVSAAISDDPADSAS